MPYYMISYDLHKVRDYKRLYECLAEWKAAKLLESVWLAELRGPASAVRDILTARVDNDDSVAVLELRPNFDWATARVFVTGNNWLRAKSP
jgi:hypothetical protein